MWFWCIDGDSCNKINDEFPIGAQLLPWAINYHSQRSNLRRGLQKCQFQEQIQSQSQIHLLQCSAHHEAKAKRKTDPSLQQLVQQSAQKAVIFLPTLARKHSAQNLDADLPCLKNKQDEVQGLQARGRAVRLKTASYWSQLSDQNQRRSWWSQQQAQTRRDFELVSQNELESPQLQ